LQKGLVETIVNALAPKFDVVIPETEQGLEPLCAIYSKSCLEPIERQLSANILKIQKFFRSVRIKKISEAHLRRNDPELLSFFNINTPDDLKLAETIEVQHRTGGIEVPQRDSTQ
jgi:molybdopterin-guanine dinucleotide biosynthesis protein A